MNELVQKLRDDGIVDPVDVLLADIAVRIQLSPTEYNKAVQRYATLEAWLNRNGSPLKGLVELFYGQGSIATGSTIARHSEREEFDIDAMVQVSLSRWADPEQVLDLLFQAIRGEPGSRYYRMTKRRTRCVTVEYEDGMHIDLTPAVRLPERNERTSHIFHSKPEDPSEPKAHFVANPYGFATHFNASTPSDADFGRFFEQRTLAREHVRVQAQAEAEPVPAQVPAYRKSRAVVSLQLIKRRRNIVYATRKDGKRPPAILLAKWVADHANQGRTLAEELQHQVDSMISVINLAHDSGDLVHEINPACAPDDVLTDRWPSSLAEQQLFLDDLVDFSAKISRLREPISMTERQEILVELFGERAARDVVKSFFEEEGQRGDTGKSRHVVGTGRLAILAAPTSLAPQVVQATPKNTFFGD